MLLFPCLKNYPNDEQLLRNMMGLLGNVAEVKQFRSSHMMDSHFMRSLK